ncbi:MAG: sensor histidine kinase [Chloroflexota bacterium]
MRSITFKMVLGFLVIGLVSTLLVVLLARWNTKTEFTRFVANRRGEDFVAAIEAYYQTHGSWEGLPESLEWRGDPPPPMHDKDEPKPGARFTLVDETGQVILAGAGFELGEQAPPEIVETGLPIQVDGETVAILLLERIPFGENPLETQFIQRTNQLMLYSALGATAVALLLGVFLSRTLTRPLRELTLATHAVSEGDLSQQVPVRSRDELGELALAFNKMSAQLARSINARRQMTADIAHELRTPLSLILGHAEAVHDGVLPPSRENFEIIREEAGRLEKLVDDLRLLSLADAGELPIMRQPIAPARLIEDLQGTYQYRARQKKVSILLDIASGLPMVELDPGRMTQVLSNVMDNALRHTPKGGSVTLAARQAGSSLELSVRDSGPGVSPEEAGRIFDRFYRADASRQREDGGSGLGLAIAKSIVQAHDGQMWAESAPGQGLTVFIHLPL